MISPIAPQFIRNPPILVEAEDEFIVVSQAAGGSSDRSDSVGADTSRLHPQNKPGDSHERPDREESRQSTGRSDHGQQQRDRLRRAVLEVEKEMLEAQAETAILHGRRAGDHVPKVLARSLGAPTQASLVADSILTRPTVGQSDLGSSDRPSDRPSDGRSDGRGENGALALKANSAIDKNSDAVIDVLRRLAFQTAEDAQKKRRALAAYARVGSTQFQDDVLMSHRLDQAA